MIKHRIYVLNVRIIIHLKEFGISDFESQNGIGQIDNFLRYYHYSKCPIILTIQLAPCHHKKPHVTVSFLLSCSGKTPHTLDT